ncbi:MAG TPA: UDP-N-acetylmuramate dehydrogenase [Nakamurella sp.]|nr:UDP-N-acetylmuramate dehydrogenase [Nakamurella sp.]
MSNPVRLSDLTTLRLGGPAPDMVTVATMPDIVDTVGAADRAGSGVLILGGGSNLVIADRGIDTPIVRIGVRGIRVEHSGDDAAEVTIGGGENWDDVVAQLTAAGFGEFAALSGIPGSAGATPIQNVGAYGCEIADVLTGVTVYDRTRREVHWMAADDLGLGYRTSVLRGTDRAVVGEMTVRLTRRAVRIRYAELARALGVALGESAPPHEVRAAVLDLRRKKGMVLDPDDPDTHSAGSFFTNPIVDREQARDIDEAIKARLGPTTTYPSYPIVGADGSADPAGRVKLSAAWLIERAGFAKGYPGPGGRVGVSGKHTLALTNRGGSTGDLIALARQIRDGVRSAFAVTLEPEPLLIGVTLDD